MPDLQNRFRALGHTRTPDLWSEIKRRHPGPIRPEPSSGRRWLAAAVALALAAAGIGFAAIAFRTGEPHRLGTAVHNGLIAFARGGSGGGIYVMNPDGTGMRQVTSEPGDTHPAWSPDGSRLAFQRYEQGRAGIYLVHADGTGLTRLATGDASSSPTWSPDGTKIVFARETNHGADLYVLDADGASLTQLTDDPLLEYTPAWSPGGSRIAFVGFTLADSGPPSALRLYVMDADGSGIEQIGPDDAAQPAWSPDGTRIVFVDATSGSLSVIGADGGGLHELVDLTSITQGRGNLTMSPTWSPDGSLIAFGTGSTAAESHLYVVNSDGSGLRQLTSGSTYDASPHWGAVPAAQPVPSQTESPTAPVALTLPLGTITLPGGSFLPEGTLLLQTDTGAQILRSGQEQSEALGVDIRPLDLSPSGTEVLAQSGDRLVSVNLLSGEESVLLQAPQDDVLGASAKWSPDGQVVAYSIGTADPASRSTLCLLATSSGSTRCFPEVGNVYAFDWSPNGSQLLVAGPPSQPLHLVDAGSGEGSTLVAQEGDTPINRAIADRGWGEAFQLVEPAWSPSGRYLAALANLRGSDFAYVPVVFTPEGQPVAFGQPSTEFPEPLAWSPSEDLLAYTAGQAPYRITGLHVLDPASGTDRTLLSSEGANWPIITDLAWSPDGRWLAVTLWRPEDNLTLDVLDPRDPVLREAKIDTGGINQALVDWGPSSTG